MTASDTVRTNTTIFPVFTTKALCMTALREASDSWQRAKILHEFLTRISNTDTSTWADPTATYSG